MVAGRANGRESRSARRERATQIVALLAREYGEPRCALDHESSLQLLVATILSAQCTDERVNRVTPALFERYRCARDYADAPPGELEEVIRSTGFFNNKAKNLRGMGRVLVDQFGSEVPRTMDELLTLPGVARKTANVVLGTAFGQAVGVVVDTHVTRIANLLRLTRSSDATTIERDLMALLPPAEWIAFSHRLIWHGRKVCIARRPRCDDCTLVDLCPSAHSAATRKTKQERAQSTRSR